MFLCFTEISDFLLFLFSIAFAAPTAWLMGTDKRMRMIALSSNLTIWEFLLRHTTQMPRGTKARWKWRWRGLCTIRITCIRNFSKSLARWLTNTPFSLSTLIDISRQNHVMFYLSFFANSSENISVADLGWVFKNKIYFIKKNPGWDYYNVIMLWFVRSSVDSGDALDFPQWHQVFCCADLPAKGGAHSKYYRQACEGKFIRSCVQSRIIVTFCANLIVF